MKTEKLQFRGQAEAINRYKSVHLEHICKWGQLLLLELLKGAPARKRCCSNGIRAYGKSGRGGRVLIHYLAEFCLNKT